MKQVEDLYSARIFGPSRDLACECGALSGNSKVGHLCMACGVFVEADAHAVRYRRVARVELPVRIRHPWTKRLVESLPVAPIAFRTAGGTPTPLGLKYERLVDAAIRLRSELPPSETRAGMEARYVTLHPELTEAVGDLVGLPPAPVLDSESAKAFVPRQNLLGMLFDSMLALDEHVMTIARCCGVVLRVSATV